MDADTAQRVCEAPSCRSERTFAHSRQDESPLATEGAERAEAPWTEVLRATRGSNRLPGQASPELAQKAMLYRSQRMAFGGDTGTNPMSAQMLTWEYTV